MKFFPEIEFKDLKDVPPMTLALVRSGGENAWAIVGTRQMRQGSPVQAAILRSLGGGSTPAFVIDKRENLTVLTASDFVIEADLTSGVEIHKNPYSVEYPSSALLVAGKQRWLVVYVLDDFDSKNAYSLNLDSGAIQPLSSEIYVTVIKHFRIGIPIHDDVSWVVTL